mmetsp:Transcript_96728/g.268904  ORF Transcript_96728/g.268904 Transcript_96728/m.268904 type:complete len:211 (+) Transcript_96728:153-785(+)
MRSSGGTTTSGGKRAPRTWWHWCMMLRSKPRRSCGPSSASSITRRAMRAAIRHVPTEHVVRAMARTSSSELAEDLPHGQRLQMHGTTRSNTTPLGTAPSTTLASQDRCAATTLQWCSPGFEGWAAQSRPAARVRPRLIAEQACTFMSANTTLLGISWGQRCTRWVRLAATALSASIVVRTASAWERYPLRRSPTGRMTMTDTATGPTTPA